jgi:purine-nucleoside phosphorylase
MPGDPLRARFIAETYLESAREYNSVRGMLGYTGLYKGRRVSVQGGGMGIPSMGIYAWELFAFYDVETIIRVGTAGGLSDGVAMGDVILALSASTDSNFQSGMGLRGHAAPSADFGLLERAASAARGLGFGFKAGHVLSTDVFYSAPGAYDSWRAIGALAVEMETTGLYLTAAKAGKKAVAILTVSDHLYAGGSAPPEERERGYTRMMEIALETAVNEGSD